MSKVATVGATALFACILCATPLSLRLSPEGNVALSVDSASAVIGRVVKNVKEKKQKKDVGLKKEKK